MSILYNVIAKMEEAIDSSKSTFKPFCSKVRFLVSKTPEVPRLNVSVSLEKNIKTFFFIKQGASKAHLAFEKDVF